MAIRNVAQSIRVGEISLGVAVGVESMSLKSVPLVRSLRRVLTRLCRAPSPVGSNRFLFICTVPALPP